MEQTNFFSKLWAAVGAAATKIWAAIGGAIIMQFSQIPVPIWLLLGMMIVDFALGSLVAIRFDKWTKLDFRNGLFRKMGTFIMLGGVAIAQYALAKEFGVAYDAVRFFAYLVLCYEFYSAAESHVKLGGPGAEWLLDFADRFRTIVTNASRTLPTPKTPEQAADMLQKQIEERGRP